MEYKEYNKRRLRTEERMGVMTLDMLQRSFNEAVRKLDKRLEGVKGVKRDLGMMNHICKRFVEAAMEGVPSDIAAQILRQSRDFRLNKERVSPVRKSEECIMPIEDEWQFVHITLESRCSICMKSGGEAKMCKIRALLRRYADEPEPGCLSDCGYCGVDLSDSKKMNKQERL